jgi:hypothetical protein
MGNSPHGSALAHQDQIMRTEDRYSLLVATGSNSPRSLSCTDAGLFRQASVHLQNSQSIIAGQPKKYLVSIYCHVANKSMHQTH